MFSQKKSFLVQLNQLLLRNPLVRVDFSDFQQLLLCHVEWLYLRLNFTLVRVLCYLQRNKQILIDAVVHAVNEDYLEMARDFTRLGFLAPGTDVRPIVPALEAIWQNSTGKGLADFNFRSVTGASHNVVNFMLQQSGWQ